MESNIDIFKTDIVRFEENFGNNIKSKEKIIDEIFEISNLEDVIEEIIVETQIQDIEVQSDEIETFEINESKVIENAGVENVNEEKQEDEKLNNNYINKFINDSTKIVMNFENRKNTIFKLDENYSQEDLEDGTTIFSLPNKNCYIIEFSSDNGNLRGNATYIINRELFDLKRNFIIENKSLKHKALSMLKLNNYKDVTRLVYTGWENAITTFFNMRTEEKYTKEEKNNINRIIEKING